MVTLNQSSYTQVEIKPEEDFAQWYIINEPKTKTYIILPKASDWDGLELSFFIKQSNWQYDVNTTHIKTSNNEYMYCKMNIYNMWSSDGTGKIYTLENFNSNYKGTKNGYWMMQPNMPVKFKSILGAWYCIDGLWTGE